MSEEENKAIQTESEDSGETIQSEAAQDEVIEDEILEEEEGTDQIRISLEEGEVENKEHQDSEEEYKEDENEDEESEDEEGDEEVEEDDEEEEGDEGDEEEDVGEDDEEEDEDDEDEGKSRKKRQRVVEEANETPHHLRCNHCGEVPLSLLLTCIHCKQSIICGGHIKNYMFKFECEHCNKTMEKSDFQYYEEKNNEFFDQAYFVCSFCKKNIPLRELENHLSFKCIEARKKSGQAGNVIKRVLEERALLIQRSNENIIKVRMAAIESLDKTKSIGMRKMRPGLALSSFISS